MEKKTTLEMHRLTVQQFREAEKLPLIVILDDVRSLYNIGSVFRTADAFRIQAIYLCGITATPAPVEPAPSAPSPSAAPIAPSVLFSQSGTASPLTASPLPPFTPKAEQEIHKTALGAEHSVSWQYFPTAEEAVRTLQARGYEVLAIEQCHGSTSLPDFRPHPGRPYAVVLGNEVKGVHQSVIDLCNGCLEIPQQGTKHSLNVSVTAGIIIWHFASPAV